MIYRILLTGARDWRFPNTIRQALGSEVFRAKHEQFTSVVLIHGACPDGADQQADTIWKIFQAADVPIDLWDAETYPGKDFVSFKARNQYMVDLGADVCLAFATRWGSGTGQTARMARRADIRTRDYGVSTDDEAYRSNQ